MSHGLLLTNNGEENIAVALNASDSSGASTDQAALLTATVDAVCNGLVGLASDARVASLRRRIVAEPSLGEAALLDIAAVIGMFNGINRVADMCGVHLDAGTMQFTSEILPKLQMDGASNWDAVAADNNAAKWAQAKL